MLVQEILEEVITLAEAADLTGQMGYALDRSNLVRYARSGRLVARKSGGTWLTTRSALLALILELSDEQRGRPRPQPPAWSQVELTPSLLRTLGEIDARVADLAAHPRAPEEQARLRRELTIEAIYHSNRIEGNRLSLPEVRAIVDAFWSAQGGEAHSTEQGGHDQAEA